MSTFSNEMSAISLELIREFGEAITFTRVTEGTYNPATGATDTGTTTTFTGYGVPDNYSNNQISERVIAESDSILYVNPTTIAPLPGDNVTVDSITYKIITVNKTTINSENVLYTLQIRI